MTEMPISPSSFTTPQHSEAPAGTGRARAGFALWGSRLDHFSLGAQWPFIVMAGAGIGLLLGPASTDAVNRSIGASYGEVTGITQTVRNFGSTIGVAVLSTVLTTVLADRLTTSLRGLGVPARQARAVAEDSARNSGTGGSGISAGSAPPAVRADLHNLVAHDFATATSWVFYGMAIALGVTFLVARRHPGDRVEIPETDPAEAG